MHSALREIHDRLIKYENDRNIDILLENEDVVQRSCEMFQLEGPTARTEFCDEIDRVEKEVLDILKSQACVNGYGTTTRAPRPGDKEFPLYPGKPSNLRPPWLSKPRWPIHEGWTAEPSEWVPGTVPERYCQQMSDDYAVQVGMEDLTCNNCRKYALEANREHRKTSNNRKRGRGGFKGRGGGRGRGGSRSRGESRGRGGRGDS